MSRRYTPRPLPRAPPPPPPSVKAQTQGCWKTSYRAKFTRAFCPPLSVAPRSPITVRSPSSRSCRSCTETEGRLRAALPQSSYTPCSGTLGVRQGEHTGPKESLYYTCYEDLTISKVPNYVKRYLPSDEQRFAIVWTQRLWQGRKQGPYSIHHGD